ncbi:hypothetical protein BDV93DRAFT_508345 [Ceratobasidium sp. AG-I]|nr:hypothetical protein BDV93DRAFT_508345 [Ceratobasidium sp. AG-I]
MSKRKVVAGGYEESSDGGDDESVLVLESTTKRPKPVPYAPPRLSTVPKAATGPFQLPRSQTPSLRGSAPPGSATSSTSNSMLPSKPLTSTSHAGTSLQNNWAVLDAVGLPRGVAPDLELVDNASRRPSVDAEVGLKSEGKKSNSAADSSSIPTKPTQARSNISLERLLNELQGGFETFVASSNEQHKRTNETLARLLDAINHWTPTGNTAFTQAPGGTFSTGFTSDAKPYHSNPVASPDLIEIVFKVLSESRNRVGKKKGGSEDNSLKEHARTTFYRMLGISAAKEIHPYFEDEHGEPDTLPVQFVDPETKYCQPYPHWKASLAKQTAWIPTYILRFRSTVPNDRSDLSTMLRGLSDEQIVVLLSDGPFKTAQTAWRDMKKADEELEAMRSNARKYQRTERKATMRGRYIKTISTLQGPEWEYLYHPGYMSQDESDDEGGLVTKRPDHRSQWETNLYQAIRIAHFNKAGAQPGPYSYPPSIKVEVVKRSIPHLERGTGTSKVTVRIALCGISKSWRENHQAELTKYAHLINTKATVKPDIAAFLSSNPMPNDNNSDNTNGNNFNNGDNVDDQWRAPGIGIELGGDKDGSGASEDEGGYEGEGEDKGGGMGKGKGKNESRWDGTIEDRVEMAIDPQLLAPPMNNNVIPGQGPRPPPFVQQNVLVFNAARPLPTFPGATFQAPSQSAESLPALESAYNSQFLGHDPQMPPPPPLYREPSLASIGAATNVKAPKAPTGQKNSAGSQLEPDAAQGASLEGGAPPKKRRGRPRGSKNKNNE